MLSKIKGMIHRFLKLTCYAISYLWVLISGQKAKSDQYLKELKDKYKGQRCFIIGNGPSLTGQDLEMLKNEITFATNKIYQIFQLTSWRPTYYGMLDEGVGMSEGVAEGASAIDCDVKFFRMEGWYAFHQIKGQKCYLHSWWSRKYLDDPHFSTDLCKGVYTIATVTYMMLQIAVWMGFDEIYLLGMDNRYAYSRLRDGTIVQNPGVVSWFSDNGQTLPDPSTAGATWEMDVAYEYAEKFSREHGFRIYNATRGGFLEKFERVSLDEVLANEDRK